MKASANTFSSGASNATRSSDDQLSWPLRAILLVVIVIATVGLGGVSALAGGPDAWYAALERPPLSPPNWVFGPVWTLLYAMMGVSCWLLVTSPTSRERTISLALFATQLLLNLAWTPIFFRLHRTDLASIEIVILLVAIVATIYFSSRVSKFAALLLLPYAAWVSFATYLCLGFWWLNG